jgi:hypothetical protein
MNLKDDDLKRFYRSFINSRLPENRKGCPALEELISFFESRRRTAKKLKIVDHITNCSACTQEFEFLLELQRYQEKIVGPVPGSRLTRLFFHSIPASIGGVNPLWRFFSVLTGMVLVFVSLFILVRNTGRFAETRSVLSPLILSQPAPEESVILPLTFAWKGLPGAETYVLELFDEALLSVWKSPETSLTYLLLPPEEAGRLRPGHRYFWMITAFSEGDKLSESELSQFTLKR